MQPRGTRIEDLAAEDPVAALGIVRRIRRAPYSFSLSATFASFTLGGIAIEAKQQAPLGQTTWIDNITYSVQQPNVFNGQVWKPVYDAALRQQTGINARIWIYAGPKYLIAPDPTPLECLFNIVNAQRWLAGWKLHGTQALMAELTLTQAPVATDSNVPPINVTITFNGWQFLDCGDLDKMHPEDAAECLRSMGYFVPKADVRVPIIVAA